MNHYHCLRVKFGYQLLFTVFNFIDIDLKEKLNDAWYQEFIMVKVLLNPYQSLKGDSGILHFFVHVYHIIRAK